MRDAIDQLIADDLLSSATGIEQSLGGMCDMFAELAAALPDASESARLLRVVKGSREVVTRVVASMRATARQVV